MSSRPATEIEIRDARPQDAHAVADVHVRSWQAAYRGLLPEAYLEGLRPEERAARYQFGQLDRSEPATLLASDAGGRILGFATTAPARDADLEGGELCALYVDPEIWGAGVGRALIGAARGRLLGEGFGEACLWVLAGNVSAERFYRADGWSADGTGRQEELGGVTVEELRYRRRLP
jgi:GNAT superfamily N-acetyltransferase